MTGNRLGSQTELVRRLRCAEGHLRGITAMIEDGADCRSVALQIRAVQEALRQIKGLIMAHHLTTCLNELLKNSRSGPCGPRALPGRSAVAL